MTKAFLGFTFLVAALFPVGGYLVDILYREIPGVLPLALYPLFSFAMVYQAPAEVPRQQKSKSLYRNWIRIWISRLSLALAGVTTLLFALSFPIPDYTAPLSTVLQALYALVSVGSFAALARIGRTPKAGRRLVALLGFTAPFMLAFNAKAIVAGLRYQLPLSPLSSAILAAPWIALLVAAACLIRSQSDIGESRPEDEWTRAPGTHTFEGETR